MTKHEINNDGLSAEFTRILQEALPYLSPDALDSLKRTMQEGARRMQSFDSMPTFTHSSGAEMLCFSVRFDDQLDLWVDDAAESATLQDPLTMMPEKFEQKYGWKPPEW